MEVISHPDVRMDFRLDLMRLKDDKSTEKRWCREESRGGNKQGTKMRVAPLCSHVSGEYFGTSSVGLKTVLKFLAEISL